MSKLKIFKITCYLLCLLCISTSLYFFQIVNQPMSIEKNIFFVDKGSSLTSVINRLSMQNIDIKPIHLKIISILFGWDKDIKFGYYKISKDMSFADLMQNMIEGEEITYKVTLSEGKTVKEYYNYLSQLDFIDNSHSSLEGLLEKIGVPKPFEGKFFPDTYFVKHNSAIEQIFLASFLKMKDVLHILWQDRADNLPFKNAYEAIILASIVEKETAFETEKNLIASVFMNRLAKKIRLQSDVTVIYALGNKYLPPLKSKDLKVKSPYNTYVRKGLPPTAISSVSLSSLKAVFYPADTQYLYFVSKKDGTHYFSKNFVEHKKAIRKYLR